MVFFPISFLFMMIVVAGIAASIYFIVRRRWGKALLAGVAVSALLVVGLVGLRVAHSSRVRIVERNTYPGTVHEHVYRQQYAIQEYVAQQQQAAVRAHADQQRRRMEQIQREVGATQDRQMSPWREYPEQVHIQGPDRDEPSSSVWADEAYGPSGALFPDPQRVYHEAYTRSWAYQGLLLTAMFALIAVVYGFLKVASGERHRSAALPVCRPRWRCG